ncbi:D-alanyl-D-alanine carboxypeptidase [Desulfovibrio sp. DV]|uniref:D-alanyl-D-alanine carboxypeptidase family protein n=1 Tax=Desulfovibrio sp. DV TaxID=1844708 RepID=UPI00094BB5C0|nr:D-alanyl-D-alanine carboxypeptidase family protein [Desulfovibrio sp. DV]OLN29666.1 D-alanyl-D-alanine carboxypeptidase [Desulfovibrio sp. DV]
MHNALRALIIALVAALVFVTAPVVENAQALAKDTGRTEKHPAKPAARKAAKAEKPAKANTAAKVEKPAKRAKAAVAEGAAKKPRRGRKAAAPINPDIENEEGDIGACAVPTLTVKSAILWNMNTGEVLYEQNPDVQIPPASLTKVLTLYILFDAIRQGKLRPWDVIEVSERAATQGGSNMHLRNGEQVKITDLIQGIAVASANDACMAIADNLENGNAEAFVALMNDTAKRLGMTNSVFHNPNGLPAEGQVTTARDMLKLAAAYLEQFPKALTIHSIQYFTHNNRQRHNANSLLGRYEGVDGLKTGFVCASGYNIVATAKRGDTRLIAVVLGSRNPRVRERETVKLLDKGFKIVQTKKAAVPVAAATPVPVATAAPVGGAPAPAHP